MTGQGHQRSILVCPDKFRGTATAMEAATWLSRGISTHWPSQQVAMMPVADGGEGTVACCRAAGFDGSVLSVSGPLGRPTIAWIATRGHIAVIEAAQACGLELVTPSPETALGASSFGVGQLIRHALDLGYREILVGVGGTASTDGGVGLLHALGARFTDAGGRDLALGGGHLADLDAIDLRGLDSRLRECHLTVAIDVENTLLGSCGAAHVYGPQKGARASEIARLEQGLEALSRAVAAAMGADHDVRATGTGAGGGIAYSLIAVLNARRASGADTVLDLIDFDFRARGAGLLLTGEGALDATSLSGKAPTVVARRARYLEVPVVMVTGQCRLPEFKWRAAGFDEVYELVRMAGSLEQSLVRTPALLDEVGRRVGGSLKARLTTAGQR